MNSYQKYYLQPGYIFVTDEPYLVHTVLGSCVAVCVWDREAGIGGMNHYLFGRARHGERTARFGNVSVPYLIQLALEKGARMDQLRAHIIGGSQHLHLNSLIGTENAQVAEAALRQYRIQVMTRDTGGQTGRKVIFNTVTGDVLVHQINKY